MDLLAIAVPFFLLALLLELAVDRLRGTGYYRLNDALNSLGAGILSTTFGYFSKLLPVMLWGLALQHLAVFAIPLEWFDLSPGGIALWALALLAFDFCYYWAHRCGHEVSILWAAHAVHHQSEDYNLSTALRQTSSGFLFGWIFYLPLFVIGIPLEVVVTVNAIDLIYQFWVHTQHIGKLGWLDRVFVTPSNHRVHHAQNEVYIDRNYGGILVLWDRLFDSFQEELDEEPVVFGVRKPLASWNPFWANVQVYAYLLHDARRTRRWRDKLGIWFRRTGWRPADVDSQYPRTSTDLQQFQKYDPPVPERMHRYLLGQFAVAAAVVLWIGIDFAAAGAWSVLLPCAWLWVLLYAIGMLSNGQGGARRFERLRLLLVTPAAVAIAYVYPLHSLGFTATVAAAAGYVLLSLVGFQLACSRDDTALEHAA